MSHPLLVTAAVLIKADRVLIAQRRYNDKVEPGKWEFPGGKVEFGETPEESLAREIKEELDLDIRVGDLLGISSHVYQRRPESGERGEKPIHVVILAYVCEVIGGELRHLAVEDAIWIQNNEISRYEFAAADLPLIKSYLKFAGSKETSTSADAGGTEVP